MLNPGETGGSPLLIECVTEQPLEITLSRDRAGLRFVVDANG
jgi:hypothetical protein